MRQSDMDPGGLEQDLTLARGRMQVELLRGSYWVVTVAALALALREAFIGGPALASSLAFVLGVGALLGSRRASVPPRALAVAFFCSLVLLITRAAFALGGAAGSSLCLAFIPGLLAGLVLGPGWGWAACAAMLASCAWLYTTMPPLARNDVLRFNDEIAITVFAAGLAHTLTRSFKAYQAAAIRRRDALLALREQREAFARAIYDELEPVAASLVRALDHEDARNVEQASLPPLLARLSASLAHAKALAKIDEHETTELGDPDVAIRTASMRVWLRLAAALMLFFVVRNLFLGAPFGPSLFSIGSCTVFHLWLGRPRAQRHLEATAFTIGLAVTVPMIVHIYDYGVRPSAPPLVVMPANVLITALLSQGPATWAVLAVSVGVVGWAGLGTSHTLLEARLLGNLAVSFVIIALALRCVFVLRLRFTRVLLEQSAALVEALRQQRRLAGTLFHDVSNHLQALMLLCEFFDPVTDFPIARSLSTRVERLIRLSKKFLVITRPAQAPALETIRVADVVAALREASAPRLSNKDIRFTAEVDAGIQVRAEPDLLVESVLGNLLSNAIKFSPRGTAVELLCERSGAFVRLVIRDSGTGVPEQVMRHLGDDGALPSRAGTAGEAGQGYGLQLAREHLERAGGRLELSAREGGGTDAVVWLPAA
ncbi:MAG TPA: HAMP domain-containing sensor histidine kinase [Polyangiaceae bacterium]|nr:HAMP domain-containing sensor histidine kinase [Polyangiaceae bacterium]